MGYFPRNKRNFQSGIKKILGFPSLYFQNSEPILQLRSDLPFVFMHRKTQRQCGPPFGCICWLKIITKIYVCIEIIIEALL
jgi:hypothetical protein